MGRVRTESTRTIRPLTVGPQPVRRRRRGRPVGGGMFAPLTPVIRPTPPKPVLILEELPLPVTPTINAPIVDDLGNLVGPCPGAPFAEQQVEVEPKLAAPRQTLTPRERRHCGHRRASPSVRRGAMLAPAGRATAPRRRHAPSPHPSHTLAIPQHATRDSTSYDEPGLVPTGGRAGNTDRNSKPNGPDLDRRGRWVSGSDAVD
jgi:hypothetical protein